MESLRYESYWQLSSLMSASNWANEAVMHVMVPTFFCFQFEDRTIVWFPSHQLLHKFPSKRHKTDLKHSLFYDRKMLNKILVPAVYKLWHKWSKKLKCICHAEPLKGHPPPTLGTTAWILCIFFGKKTHQCWADEQVMVIIFHHLHIIKFD